MSTVALIFIFAIFIPSGTADKGKDYAKEKVCEDLRLIGAQNYKEIVTALYSQKFPNGTFEEVKSVADEMTKLALECCRDDASSDCYDKGATEITEKSCETNSPFPKHPGIKQCCTIQGDNRKLCLAMLRYTADELPSLLEPTPEDICTQYIHNPSTYATRYVYEFARRHRNIPAGFVLNATQNHVKMAENCCNPTTSNRCFFNERFHQRGSTVFLRFLSKVCNNQVNLKYYKTGLTAYFGRLLRVPFEDALALSKHFQSSLSKCCLQPQPECIIEEFISFQKHLCNNTGTMNEELQKCCSKAPLDTLTCMDDLKTQHKEFSDRSQVLPAQLCEKPQPDTIERYLFEIGVKQVSVSLPVLTTIQEELRRLVEGCCSGTDEATACLKKEEGKLEKTTALLSRIDNFCLQYFKLDLPAFKTMVQQEFQSEEAQNQAWLDLTSSCCSQHSPAQLCQKLTEAVI